LAAQHAPADDTNRTSSARFFVLDSTPGDSPRAGYLARLADLLPHPVQVAGWRDLPGVISLLAEEVERRQKSHEAEGPETYLIIPVRKRFRDLRGEEDDFGSFGSNEEQKANVAKQFTAMLREAAELGVHMLVWCDSYNNAARSFDRQAMREFEMRVLFQMSAGDSSSLIDS